MNRAYCWKSTKTCNIRRIVVDFELDQAPIKNFGMEIEKLITIVI